MTTTSVEEICELMDLPGDKEGWGRETDPTQSGRGARFELGKQVIGTTIQRLEFTILWLGYINTMLFAKFHDDIEKIHRV
jgi:hypothetical protein